MSDCSDAIGKLPEYVKTGFARHKFRISLHLASAVGHAFVPQRGRGPSVLQTPIWVRLELENGWNVRALVTGSEHPCRLLLVVDASEGYGMS